MLLNPFTPSEIASDPLNFFGRKKEMETIERGLMQGSVAIEGAIGIGKSSLLSHINLLMEGFSSSHNCITVVAVGDGDINNIDEAARLLLEAFTHVDETTEEIGFTFKSIISYKSAELCKLFAEGRHLAALKRIVEKETLNHILKDGELLIITVDEADKCPVPLARLVRSLATHTQQHGVNSIRFVFVGVSPFFQKMIDEDSGINRFFYKRINLQPLAKDEAQELLETKLDTVISHAEEMSISLNIDEDTIERVIGLSGGHPHLLQLLGSHLIENENDNPDNFIDNSDLINSLQRICYEDRAYVYKSIVHLLDVNGKLDDVNTLIDLADEGFPTMIPRMKARKFVDGKTLQWLVENNILSTVNPKIYGLIDEFLRIRIVLDEAAKEQEIVVLERRMIESGSIRRPHFNLEPYDEGRPIYDKHIDDNDEIDETYNDENDETYLDDAY